MRIVSLLPSVTDVLVSLGLEDGVVGVTPFCLPWLKRKGLGDVVLAGDYLNIKIDKLKKLRPDVVFIQSRVHDRFLEPLRAMGFNVFLVALPSSVLDALVEVIRISDIVGRGYEGRLMVSKLYDGLKPFMDESRILPTNLRHRVYVEFLWPNWTYSTSGSLTYINDIVWLAKGLNIFHDVVTEFFTARDDDIFRLKPRAVLVNIEPYMKINMDKYLSKREAISRLVRELTLRYT